MKSKVHRNGKTTIPAEIRARHNIKEGDRLIWLDDGQTICIIPASAEPFLELFGIWSKRTDIKDSLEICPRPAKTGRTARQNAMTTPETAYPEIEKLVQKFKNSPHGSAGR